MKFLESNNSETKQNEYLIYAKEGFRKATPSYIIPVTAVYTIADYLNAPGIFGELLFVRISSIIFAWVGMRRLMTAKSWAEFMKLAAVFIFFFSAVTNYFVWRIDTFPSLYYAGLALVIFGALGIYPFPKTFSAAVIAVTYLPPLIYAWKFQQDPRFYFEYSNLLIFAIATTCVIWMARNFHELLLQTEISSRLLLQNELEIGDAELKLKSRELFKTKEDLEKTRNEAQQDLAIANIARQAAHDIRSPLSALSVVTSSLQSISPEHRALAQIAISRITSTAEELLSSAKANLNKPEHKVSRADIQSPLADLVKEKQAAVPKAKSISFSLDYRLTDHLVVANEAYLLRIFSNILDNSIDAIEAKGTVQIVAEPRENNFVEFLIEDTGKGIPASHLSKIGTKYFTHGKSNGNGIAIHFARTQIELWGGELLVESIQSKGTRVKILLPTSPK